MRKTSKIAKDILIEKQNRHEREEVDGIKTSTKHNRNQQRVKKNQVCKVVKKIQH